MNTAFTVSMIKEESRIQAQVRTAAWDTQLHRGLHRGNVERGIMYVFVTSRVTNHHDKGHFRKSQTLSYALSACKVAGFRGMGPELWEIFTLILSLTCFF